MIAPGESYFRSAILDADGDVDAGYYAMVWGLRVWKACSASVMSFGAFALWYSRDQPSEMAGIIQAVGIAEGALAAAYATMLAAVGVFRMGDRQPSAAVGLTTTTKEKTTTTEAAPVAPAAEALARGTPDKPLHVAVEDDPTPSKRRAKP